MLELFIKCLFVDSNTYSLFYRPGFVRLNLPYFMNTDELNYITEAVDLLSQHAWKMLPFVSTFTSLAS